MAAVGTVREFDRDAGFGVIDSADTPGGCFVHFSVIDRPGYGEVVAGEQVRFEFEAGPQDGFRYRATHVFGEGGRPVGVTGSEAYGSNLIITDADGTVHRP